MSKNVVVKAVAETTKPTGLADGAEIQPWYDEFGRLNVGLQKEEVTLLASGARTAETASDAQHMPYHKGVMLFVDVTVDAAAGAITPTIEINDSIGSTAFTVWTAAAPIAAVGQYCYMIYPAPDAGSWTENLDQSLPVDWTFRMTVADTDSLTYSVTAVYLP